MAASIDPFAKVDGTITSPRGAFKKNFSNDMKQGLKNPHHYVNGTAIDGGSVDARAAILAADTDGPVVLPPGTYAIASNMTLTNKIAFDAGAKLKPASGVVVTLSGNYSAEDDQHVFDISAGGSFSVPNCSRLSVMHFGAIGDYAYPSLGTDDSAAIQACLDAAEAASVSSSRRVEVVFPPFEFKIASFLTVAPHTNFSMEGARLIYTGSDKSDAVVTVGDASAIADHGRYTGINIVARENVLTIDEDDRPYFAALRVRNTSYCEFDIHELGGASIGLQLWPGKSEYVTHCRFYGTYTPSCKDGIELRGGFGDCYVNENDFIASNLTFTSSSTYLGAVTGVKFSVQEIIVTFNATTDEFTATAHGLVDDDSVHLYSETGSSDMPGNFSTLTTYYVINATANTFQLSTSVGGAAVNGSSAGSDLRVFGYAGQNNNRFFGACFQVPGHVSSFEINSTGVVTTGYRYINMANLREYYCVTGGTVGVPPTHTSGQATDNGVTFQYVGHYLRCPIWFDKAGSSNFFEGCRWEGGYGAFARVTSRDSSSLAVQNNEMSVYLMDSNALAEPIVDYFTDTTVNIAYKENKVRLYGQSDASSISLNNVHKRAIGSSGNLVVQGMCWKVASTNVITQYESVTAVLCRDAIYVDSSAGTFRTLGTCVDMREYSAVEFNFSRAAAEIGRLNGYFMDKNFDVVTYSAVTDVSVGIMGGALLAIEPTWYSWKAESNTILPAFARRNPDNTDVRYLFISMPYNGFEITSLHAQPILSGTEGDYGRSPLVLTTPFEADATHGQRSSYGTPDVGFFETRGEFIGNLNTTAGQPIGWYVKTPGILAPAWAGNTPVRKGELRLSDTNKIYASLEADTTANPGTAPTGTGSSIDDGSVLWEYVGPQAVLTATTQTH